MRVERDKFKQAILMALADKEMVGILEYATAHPRSVSDVIRETGISHSTAYRKTKWMLEQGLLYTEKIEITSDGKKFSLFRSTLKSVDASYNRGNLAVEIEYNVNVVEENAKQFFSLEAD